MRRAEDYPRDVLAMLHLLARWGQSQGINGLRIEPGKRGSDVARIIRYVPAAAPIPAPPRPTKVKRPRRLILGIPEPVAAESVFVESLPLRHEGGTHGLTSIRLFKRCSRCKKDLFIEEFSRQPGQADGRGAYCKQCKLSRTRIDRDRRMHQVDPTIDRRLWSLVDKKAPGGCWLWQGGQQSTNYGYGYIQFRGSQRATHLVAWELLRGPRPKGRIAHHKCGDRRCVNPDHLIFVTRRELSLQWAKDNPFRQNALKARCHQGHEYTAANTHHFRIGTAVTRVCLTCLRARSPGTRKRANLPRDAMQPRQVRLIEKAAPYLKKLPAVVREDARGILYQWILEGQVNRDNLATFVKRSRRVAWRGMPDRWRTVSMDAPRGADGDATLQELTLGGRQVGLARRQAAHHGDRHLHK